MNNKKTTNWKSGIIITLVGVVYYIQSYSIRITKIGGKYNSRMFPQLIAVILILMGILLVIRDAKLITSFFRRAERVKAERSFSLKGLWAQYGKVILIFALLFGYAGGLQILGYLLSTPIFVYLFIMLLTPQNTRHKHILNAWIALGSTFLFYAMFRYGFTMILPKGII